MIGVGPQPGSETQAIAGALERPGADGQAELLREAGLLAAGLREHLHGFIAFEEDG